MSEFFRKCIPYFIYLALVVALASVGFLLWKQGKSAVAEPVLLSEQIREVLSETKGEQTFSEQEGADDFSALKTEGALLFNVHALRDEVYILYSSENCLSVAVCDYENTVRSTVLLAENEEFISSDWVSDGLCVVTRNGTLQKTFVRLIKNGTAVETLFSFSALSSAKLLADGREFFLIGESENGTFLYRFREGKTIFKSLGQGKTVDAFLMSDTLTVFLTERESRTKLTVDRETLDVVIRENGTGELLFTVPFGQGFASVVQKDTLSVELFDGEKYVEKDLGILDIKRVFSHENNLYFLLNGGECGFFCLQGTAFSLEESTPFLYVSDMVTDGDSLFFLASDRENNLFFVTQKGSAQTATSLPFYGEFFILFSSPNNTFYVAVQEENGITVIRLDV